jgi:hypothetical protein
MAFIQKLSDLYREAPVSFSYTLGANRLRSMDNYSFNMVVVFGFLFVIFFLYVKLNISIDQKNWDIQKCNPRYLFYSGYIQKNGDSSAYDSTVDNFNECTNRVVTEYSDTIVSKGFQNTLDNLNKKLITFDNQAIAEKKVNEKVFQANVTSISTQFDKMKEDISMNTNDSLLYANLKNIGIYMDQLNAIMTYIGEYTKQYLTYRMMDYANKCVSDPTCKNIGNENYARAVQLRDILNTYYGGNNL